MTPSGQNDSVGSLLNCLKYEPVATYSHGKSLFISDPCIHFTMKHHEKRQKIDEKNHFLLIHSQICHFSGSS